MKNGAIVCFVLSALTTLGGIKSVVSGQNRPEEIENYVGYAVGSFLVPVVLLISGLVLLGKAKDAGRSE